MPSKKYEKMKRYIREWDRENMRTLSCRVRTHEAEIFKEYCSAHDTTPGNLIKTYVFKCIEEYGKELRRAELAKEAESGSSRPPKGNAP